MKALALPALVLAGGLLSVGATESQEPPSGSLPAGVDVQFEDSRAFDVPPKPVKTVMPEYPKAAREKGLTGTVHLEATVDVAGRVKRVRVTRSVAGLDEAAVECVKRWRFAPARKHGEAVEAVALIVIRFKPAEPPKPIPIDS